MAFEALVFDLDGVLVDTENAVFSAWCRVFSRFDCELSLEDWNRTVGGANGALAVYERLGAQTSAPLPPLAELRAEVRELQGELFATMEPMAGVRDWLTDARRLGLGLALASSSPASWVSRCLERTGLAGAFSSVHSPDALHAAKPAPDLYRAACAALRADPAHAIAVEDSRNGVTAAVAAGLSCIAVPNAITAGADLRAAQLRVGSLADVPLHEALRLLSPAPAGEGSRERRERLGGSSPDGWGP